MVENHTQKTNLLQRASGIQWEVKFPHQIHYSGAWFSTFPSKHREQTASAHQGMVAYRELLLRPSWTRQKKSSYQQHRPTARGKQQHKNAHSYNELRRVCCDEIRRVDKGNCRYLVPNIYTWRKSGKKWKIKWTQRPHSTCFCFQRSEHSEWFNRTDLTTSRHRPQVHPVWGFQ